MKSIAMIALLPVMFSACGKSKSSSPDPLPSVSPAPSSGDASGNDSNNPGAFVKDYRSSSDFFTLTDGPVDGSSPHGLAQIWYSTSVEEFVGQSGFTAPVGTVAIKEADTDKDGTVDMLTVMVKKEEGFDSKNSNWSYEMRSTDGELMEPSSVGANPMCIGCHTAWKQQDYLPGLLILAKK